MKNVYRTGSTVVLVAMLGLGLGACSNTRPLPMVFMPDPPKECDQVMDFKVEPLPQGKSTATKLAVDMAKEGVIRQEEHAKSKVCAEYALRTAGVMKDKDRKPAAGEPVVDASKRVPKARTSRPERVQEEPFVVSGGGAGG